MTDHHTRTEIRLTFNPAPDSDKPRWLAELVDVEANVEWFEEAGESPMDAVMALAEELGAVIARQSWEITTLNVEAERRPAVSEGAE